ncbi:glucan endo-1,3-beta-glucosidase 8-like [Momordica charantia]|uniref:glucan endo-1,3-beta-D-glucosidase n=1 Tax=Momordica charantia TaxID=3673 RepID=A0A6J1BT10_MOMCH|nr:glucan endo-1,3-beta-glucosidase 8-like [Momordica charantia]
MAGGMFFHAVWAVAIAVAAVAAGVSAEGTLGVNWGTVATNPLDGSIVVQLLKDNGIKRVKLFDLDSAANLSVLAGTGIKTIVGIRNELLETFATDYNLVKDWVKQNISTYMGEGGVDIIYIAVGNEPFLGNYQGKYVNTTFPAMQNVQKALEAAGHSDKIKTQNQNPEACDFGGAAKIVTKNATVGDCLFQIQIMRAASESPSPSRKAGGSPSDSAGERLRIGAASAVVGLIFTLFAYLV